jgi:hypothetical protein
MSTRLELVKSAPQRDTGELQHMRADVTEGCLEALLICLCVIIFVSAPAVGASGHKLGTGQAQNIKFLLPVPLLRHVPEWNLAQQRQLLLPHKSTM